MYDFLRGDLAVRKPGFVVVDVGGVGYRVEIPLSTYQKLPPSGAVTIFTSLRVSENDMRLFGFATRREREVFLRLVESVPQLGPSKAVMILSNMDVEQLMAAVEEGDAGSLRRIKGIGPKIANRLVLELKGKLPEMLEGEGSGDFGTSNTKDVVEALVSLGFDRGDAEKTVRKIRKDVGQEADGLTVEELLRRCLEKL